jgi:hypothetical protein
VLIAIVVGQREADLEQDHDQSNRNDHSTGSRQVLPARSSLSAPSVYGFFIVRKTFVLIKRGSI